MEGISFLHKNIWAYRRGKEVCSISPGAFGAEQAQIPSFALVPFLFRLTKHFFLKRFCHPKVSFQNGLLVVAVLYGRGSLYPYFLLFDVLDHFPSLVLVRSVFVFSLFRGVSQYSKYAILFNVLPFR